MTSTFRWLGLALLGILIAVAISIAASRLASQQIGLASQPISAGDALAPAGQVGERPPPHPQTGRGHELPVPAEPVPPALVEPATPTSPEQEPAPAPAPAHGDESGGSGGGGAGGGDD